MSMGDVPDSSAGFSGRFGALAHGAFQGGSGKGVLEAGIGAGQFSEQTLSNLVDNSSHNPLRGMTQAFSSITEGLQRVGAGFSISSVGIANMMGSNAPSILSPSSGRGR